MESLGRSQGQKPEGPQAPRHDSPKAFPHNVILLSYQIVKWDFFQPMDSLGSIMVNIQIMKPCILVELNPIILGRDVERMLNIVHNNKVQHDGDYLVFASFCIFSSFSKVTDLRGSSLGLQSTSPGLLSWTRLLFSLK